MSSRSQSLDPSEQCADDDVEFYNDDWTPENTGSSDDNFKVIIRVRPPLPRELRGTALRGYQCTTHVNESSNAIMLSENLPSALQSSQAHDLGMMYATYKFAFDHVYDQDNSQEEVYGRSAQQVVLSILQGYNAAIIAYGQTGTGKTYTMEGELEGKLRGIIPRTVEDIFTYIVNDPEPTSKYLVRASYLQIYNEVISDLLKPERTNLVIREDKRRGVFVEGLSEWVVRSPSEVYQLMSRGQDMRATGATKLNEVSSRSHAVCIIIVEKCTTRIQDEQPGVSGSWSRPSTASRELAAHSIKVGKLNLVDLAGSERVHVTGAVGKRLEESKKINASLSALGNVIAALTDKRERTHIPYRDSKLTRILEDSLGGNCKTTMICTIAPSLESFQESLSTLKFANRAKNIKNDAHVNEDLDQRTLLRKYERELRKLRAELQKRSKELVDKRALIEVEEQKRRAEQDKLAALTELEKRSREFMHEKAEKKALEAKISAMQSQLLMGGVGMVAGSGKLEEIPAFRALLAREHKRIRGEYEAKLRELESERQLVDTDRQQVDRFKGLVLKQRDIMIALTQKLNERDEQIQTLQEELDALDRHARQMEDALDQKRAELIALRKAAVEHAVATPLKSAPLQSVLGAWGSMAGSAGGQREGLTEDTRQMADTYLLASSGGGSGDEGAHDGAVEVMQMTDRLARTQLADEVVMRLEEREAQVQQLQQENMCLAEQLHAATVGSSSRHGPADEALLQRLDTMTSACAVMQKERSALKQILQTRVKKALDDVINMAASGGSAEDVAQRQALLTKLSGLEVLMSKIQDAIEHAPPVVPE